MNLYEVILFLLQPNQKNNRKTTMKEGNKIKKRVRFIHKGDLLKLSLECECSSGSIYNALLGNTNTELAEKIREKAKAYDILYY